MDLQALYLAATLRFRAPVLAEQRTAVSEGQPGRGGWPSLEEERALQALRRIDEMGWEVLEATNEADARLAIEDALEEHLPSFLAAARRRFGGSKAASAKPPAFDFDPEDTAKSFPEGVREHMAGAFRCAALLAQLDDYQPLPKQFRHGLVDGSLRETITRLPATLGRLRLQQYSVVPASSAIGVMARFIPEYLAVDGRGEFFARVFHEGFRALVVERAACGSERAQEFLKPEELLDFGELARDFKQRKRKISDIITTAAVEGDVVVIDEREFG